ncbi:MAG: zinc ribbon domain-containing protein [Pseudomonadota bacterium]
MAQTCNNCSAELEDGMKFCPHCGAKTPEQIHAESIVEQTKHYVGEAAEELWGATKDAAKETYKHGKHITDMDSAKKLAGGAALGAAAGLIAPVGVAAGAAIGAGVVAYRHITKKQEEEEEKKKK